MAREQCVERHRPLTICLVSRESIQYESSLYAVRIQTLNAIQYPPKDFFAMLTSELCDKINDRKVRRRQYNILLVLRDTVDTGKFHMGNINGITCRWLTC